MANIFSKLISKITGGGSSTDLSAAEGVVADTLKGILERGGFVLDFSTSTENDTVSVEFTGDDTEALTQKEGMLLDAFQFLLKRVVQHQFPDQKIEVGMDAGGFRESSAQELVELAEKLRGLVLDKGRPVFVRSLPPRDRKVIHRHLAEDARIVCKSVGDGLYKKIRISLAGDETSPREGGDGREGRHGGHRGGRKGGRRRNNNRRGGSNRPRRDFNSKQEDTNDADVSAADYSSDETANSQQ